MNIKQKAREMFDKCSIKMEWKEKPEIADVLQHISDVAFEKQKLSLYPILDQIIDLAIAEERKQMIEKIDINKLQGNQPAEYDEEESIPYQDIELLATKMNEIIEFLNNTR